MARGFLIFFVLWALAFSGISTWRNWTFRSTYSIVKVMGMSGLAALFTLGILGLIVFLF